MSDYSNNYYYYPGPGTDNKISTSIFLFTDRSIYRPGQILYFKGIAISGDWHDAE